MNEMTKASFIPLKFRKKVVIIYLKLMNLKRNKVDILNIPIGKSPNVIHYI